MKNKYLKIIIPIVIIAIVLLPGCSGKSNKESKKPAQPSSQKPPEELKKIVSDIETMITNISELINMKSSTQQIKIADTSSNQSNTSEQSGNNQSGKSQNKSTQNKQQSGQQTEQTNSNSMMQQQKSWQTLAEKLKDIHKNWNKIESEAIKAGLTVAERKKFEASMENLTMAISQKDEMNSLKAAIELYGQYASLAKVFKSSIPADYYRTKYEILSAGIEAMGGEWDKAVERMPLLKESWNSFKTQVKVKDEKLLSRSDLSMDDFEAAVAGKNKELLLIKTEIVLENLKQIEKSISKSNSAQ